MTDIVAEQAPERVVVARRPIVDRDRAIVGFELIYQPQADAADVVPGSDRGVIAVSRLLRDLNSALDDVVGDKLAFCHVDRDLLPGDIPLMLPPRRTVIQLSDAEVDDEVLEGCEDRRVQGYRIALERFTGGPGAERLLELADIVKVDLSRQTREDVVDLVQQCRAFPVRLLAQGCDSEDEMAWAHAAGFELFQGTAAQSPPIDEGATLAPSALSQLQLGVELLSEDLDLERVESILRAEPGLVVQVLNLASVGAGRGLRRKVKSLREALVVMGTVRLRQWAALTILGRHGRVDTDALVTGLVRARMCELLAQQRGMDQAFAFTAGLLSTLDQLLGMELSDIEERLQVDEELAAAAFHGRTAVGQLVTEVAAYQALVDGGLPPGRELAHLGLVGAMAFCWATVYVNAMDAEGSAGTRSPAMASR